MRGEAGTWPCPTPTAPNPPSIHNPHAHPDDTYGCQLWSPSQPSVLPRPVPPAAVSVPTPSHACSELQLHHLSVGSGPGPWQRTNS